MNLIIPKKNPIIFGIAASLLKNWTLLQIHSADWSVKNTRLILQRPGTIKSNIK